MGTNSEHISSRLSYSAAVKSSMREVAAKSPRRSARDVKGYCRILTPVFFLQKQAFRLINVERAASQLQLLGEISLLICCRCAKRKDATQFQIAAVLRKQLIALEPLVQ